MEATGDDTTAEETPQFSLHAIAGVAFSDTMQIQVALGDATIIALLDSGSTHNSSRRTPLSALGCLSNTAHA